MLDYHDREWGIPTHDDRTLFEFLVLEGAQAGLSWMTILRKRQAYRAAFHGFDPRRVARMTGADVERLLQDVGIVRNRRKIESAIANARVVLQVQLETGSLDRFLSRFVNGQPSVCGWRSLGEIPAQTNESRMMSKNLIRRGASFVGPTICYAFMQATGMVNDHVVSCFRYEELTNR